MSDYPHVTTVIHDAGLMGNMDFVPLGAMTRGTNVHKATQYLDEGDLDRSSLSDEVAARLVQYEKFKAEVQPEILEIEQYVEHPQYRYCGTPDRVVKIGGLIGILDIKGPMESPWHILQLAAYIAAKDVGHGWNLYLTDQRPKLVKQKPQELVTGKAAFLSALNIFNWKRENHV